MESRDCLSYETHTLRIENYEEALLLFLELVLACFFVQESGLEARERERAT